MPTVLITGANRGIGLEFARQYVADGWEVVATARHPDEADDLIALGVERHPLDVADFAGIESLARGLAGRPIDVLLNNAGVYGGRQDFGDIDPDDWAYTLRVNALAPLMMARAFVGHLEGGRRKIIANMSSKMGSMADNGSGGVYSYRSSKAAQNAVTRSLSHDLAPRGIICLALHPGWVRTRMGGGGALIGADESAAGLRRVIDSATPAHSGRFWNHDGQEIPW